MAVSAVALSCVVLAVGADQAPKPAHGFDLPFAEGHVRRAWVGFSSDGKQLAAYYVAKKRAYVAVWDAAEGKLLHKTDVGEATFEQGCPDFGPPARFTPDGKFFAYLTPGKVNFLALVDGSLDRSARVPEYKSRAETYTGLARADDKEVQHVTYRTAEAYWQLTVCSSGKTAKVIDEHKIELPTALAATLSPDSGSLAWLPGEGVIGPARAAPFLEILDLKTKRAFRLREEKPTTESWYNALAYAPDGKRLATGNSAGGVALWNPAKEKPLWVYTPRERELSVGAVAFSGDGSALAAGTYNKKGKPNVLILSTANGKLERAWSDNDTGVLHLAWHPQKRQLAVLGGLKVTIYDVPAPK
jgi:WD40 repeat protein